MSSGMDSDELQAISLLLLLLQDVFGPHMFFLVNMLNISDYCDMSALERYCWLTLGLLSSAVIAVIGYAATGPGPGSKSKTPEARLRRQCMAWSTFATFIFGISHAFHLIGASVDLNHVVMFSVITFGIIMSQGYDNFESLFPGLVLTLVGIGFMIAELTRVRLGDSLHDRGGLVVCSDFNGWASILAGGLWAGHSFTSTVLRWHTSAGGQSKGQSGGGLNDPAAFTVLCVCAMLFVAPLALQAALPTMWMPILVPSVLVEFLSNKDWYQRVLFTLQNLLLAGSCIHKLWVLFCTEEIATMMGSKFASLAANPISAPTENKGENGDGPRDGLKDSLKGGTGGGPKGGPKGGPSSGVASGDTEGISGPTPEAERGGSERGGSVDESSLRVEGTAVRAKDSVALSVNAVAAYSKKTVIVIATTAELFVVIPVFAAIVGCLFLYSSATFAYVLYLVTYGIAALLPMLVLLFGGQVTEFMEEVSWFLGKSLFMISVIITEVWTAVLELSSWLVNCISRDRAAHAHAKPPRVKRDKKSKDNKENGSDRSRDQNDLNPPPVSLKSRHPQAQQFQQSQQSQQLGSTRNVSFDSRVTELVDHRDRPLKPAR